MCADQPGREEFISEPIVPEPGSADIRSMAIGEPGLPARFTWRERIFDVKAVVQQWKTSSREGGTGRLYLRRHWYTILTGSGEQMTIYCERQARSRRQAKSRWWLYTIHH